MRLSREVSLVPSSADSRSADSKSPHNALPRLEQAWPPADALQADVEDALTREQGVDYLVGKPWVWRGGLLYFFCDLHADADAFLLSLHASGGVHRTGPEDHDFELTAAGRTARFVIGGDCFDKGPSNLRMLRALKSLIDRGAEVVILAGNHDLRTYLGLARLGNKETRLAHLFVRLGGKSATLFREVYDEYLRGRSCEYLSDEEVHRRVFPDPAWYAHFPNVAGDLIHPDKLQKELVRIREKVREIDERCARMGISLGMLHAAAVQCQKLFLEPDGEFAWFFERMQLAYRCGSYLFIHGGVDDTTAAVLATEGSAGLNSWFRHLLQNDLFALYHGPVGNTFRTKYRSFDLPLTGKGVADLHRAGIFAIVHGHKNILAGQRLVMRRGILNFECDASVDRNTRRREGLSGPGGAVTIFEPDGRVLGVSTDHPYIKVFDPARLGGALSKA